MRSHGGRFYFVLDLIEVCRCYIKYKPAKGNAETVRMFIVKNHGNEMVPVRIKMDLREMAQVLSCLRAIFIPVTHSCCYSLAHIYSSSNPIPSMSRKAHRNW